MGVNGQKESPSPTSHMHYGVREAPPQVGLGRGSRVGCTGAPALASIAALFWRAHPAVPWTEADFRVDHVSLRIDCAPRRRHRSSDEREPRTDISQVELQLHGLRDATCWSLHQLCREGRGADLRIRPRRRYCGRAVFRRLPRGAPAVLLHAARALARATSVLGSGLPRRLAGWRPPALSSKARPPSEEAMMDQVPRTCPGALRRKTRSSLQISRDAEDEG